jgi:predicted transport protein
MSEITLFRIGGGKAVELPSHASDLEKPLQTLIEENLDTLLGIRFLATEYPTGKTHAGRIDTLGIDENDCPVILEYKRSAGENVINQGLFYLDWLMDHQAEFKLLVLERYGKDSAEAIDWFAPRLICVASDFTKYDGHAVQQMNRNIELVRYRKFGPDLLLLELVNAVSANAKAPSAKPAKNTTVSSAGKRGTGKDKTVAQWLTDLSPSVASLFSSLEGFAFSLGDDVQRKDLRLYVAFKRLKNFVTVVFQKDRLLVYLRLDPEAVDLREGFSRDVRQIGHWGTGDLELSIADAADLEQAKPLVALAYEGGRRAG